ncbi:hypothetical protein TSUD_316990 [Trifolium subterraneum]|uniref:Protein DETOXIFICATION n=1 Tax=Trifolium subterraneum TaxID=3900 RepID=A0A2Z6N6Q7_TRISU|nr:hypothetical protein TSUD_316990 [Trifolium subterraneum]
MGSIDRENENDNLIQSLLSKEISTIQEEEDEEQEFGKKLWIETKKLWLIVGPSIFSRVASFTMNVVTQAFAGHLGQPDDVAEWTGVVAIWFIPLHFSFAFQFPLQSWLLVFVWDFGLIGAAIALDVSWWILVFGMLGYTVFGGCPLTWTGFSIEAFSGLWDFFKLSFASGVMLCLENWYYRILLLMTGQLENATVAVDALSVWVRVANELGAGKGKSAKFAMQVSVAQSTVIGFIFCVLIMIFHRQFAYIFTTSPSVLEAVNHMTILLAVTILLNSVQPILSGVAVGSGWQGVWAGMIFGGTAIQTLILIIVTARCDWKKEAEKATSRVNKWSITNPDDQLQITN